MPKVGSRHFAYDKKGVEDARRYARKTGKTVAEKPNLKGLKETMKRT